jgi:hypothetical protein
MRDIQPGRTGFGRKTKRRVKKPIEDPKEPQQRSETMARATLRLPQSLWDAVQHQAIDQRIPASELVARAVREYLKKGGRS